MPHSRIRASQHHTTALEMRGGIEEGRGLLDTAVASRVTALQSTYTKPRRTKGEESPYVGRGKQHLQWLETLIGWPEVKQLLRSSRLRLKATPQRTSN